LRGLALYNYIFKQVSETNKRLGDRQQLGQEGKRKKASLVYNKFKKQGGFTATDIRDDITRALEGLPPVEICNPLYLSGFQLQDIEYYQIDEHLRNVLPDCLDVRLNAGSLGVTRIFNTRNYNYYNSKVRRIVENIRRYLKTNTSGQAVFNGVVRLKRGKKNDGDGNNYFVEFFLSIDNEPFEGRSAIPVEFGLNKAENTKKERIGNNLARRLSKMKQKKRSEKIKRGRVGSEAEREIILKKEYDSKISAVRREVNKIKKLYLQGVITKRVYDAELKSLDVRRQEIVLRYKKK